MRGVLTVLRLLPLAGLVWTGAALLALQSPDSLALPQEIHLRHVRQLTFEGENAEAYFSSDDRRLIFQASRPGVPCDQIFVMDVDGSDERMVSTGEGKTTCAFFFPGGQRILYSSTHLADPNCPPRPDYSLRLRSGQARGYVWPVYEGYDIFLARADGSGLRRLTAAPGYDAEATISSDGAKVVFTSMRNGDLDLYVMEASGSNVRRLTHEVGYDGGAFFSPDGTKIVYRAYHPTDSQEIADYRSLLREGLIRPTTLEIWVMDADGSNKRQLTSNGAANFAPYWHPDGKRIIFASNLRDPRGRNFDLYLINEDGTGLERVTYSPVFDGFPMFSHDGRKLVWASNRQPEAGAPGAHNARRRGDTNIFIADWVE